ncbi:hypothetical protein Leryth_022694 [Lithospermum erythrorhizon]|nr:hypothetical protein Leryth_022694 [Lithospermum erythrorhizon]
MMEKLWNPRNSQRQQDRQMRIVFVFLTSILIIIFLTPFYFIVTDPQAPRITHLSSEAQNFRVSPNHEYVTSDWKLTFSVENTDNVYRFLYESINADVLDKDRSVVVASAHHPSFSQGTNTVTDLVLKFRNTLCSISELNENDSNNGGNSSGNAAVSISMRWKLSIYGGSEPRSRYNGLNVNCNGKIVFSFNNSKEIDVSFVDDDDGHRCDAHLVRI